MPRAGRGAASARAETKESTRPSKGHEVGEKTEAMNPEATNDSVPEQIGEYKILRRIGAGAMSVVYEGVNPATRQSVAVKVLDPALLSDADAIKRIEREARALDKIRHPNVAQLMGFGRTPAGSPFLVFELVVGHTLAELIEMRMPVDPLAALAWLEEAALALCEAWKRKIIHRDIKPGNLMVQGDGQLKMVDFGLAKALFEDVDHTQENSVLGTPRYMSPEMSLGQSLDFRADMYSLGATFYHLLVGQSPFDAATAAQMMMKHATSPLPTPRSIEPGIPADIESILMRLLAKDAGGRYESYDDLCAAIRESRLAIESREAAAAAAGGADDSAFEGDPASLDPAFGIGSSSNPSAPEPGPIAQDDTEDAFAGDPSLLDPVARAAAHPGETGAAATSISATTTSSETARRHGGPIDDDERRARAMKIDLGPPAPRASIFARATVVLAIVLIGAGAYYAMQNKAGRPPGRGRTAGAGGWIDAKINGFLASPRAAERSAEDARTETMQIMEAAMSAVLRYEAASARVTRHLDEVVAGGYMRADAASDAWGKALRFQALTGTLRSSGRDGTLGTADDFVIDNTLNFTKLPAQDIARAD